MPDLKLIEAIAKQIKSKLDMPLCVLDVESSGTSPANDEIIQLSVVKINMDGSIVVYDQLYKTEKPIPAQSSKVHNIYDKDVENCPSFKKHAKIIISLLKGCRLAGYNSDNFDIKILNSQLDRCGYKNVLDNYPTYDAMKVFFKHSPRKLANALEFYTKEVLEDAHNAMNDVMATLKVISSQLKSEDKPIKDIIQSAKDQTQSDRFIIEVNGKKVLNFGKHKGTPLDQVDPGFLNWCLKKDFPDVFLKAIAEYV